MEIPTKLKKLYRHWDFHTLSENKPIRSKQIFKDIKLFNNISWFIKERMDIWKKKISGKVPPFTKDPVLSKYRFCNIFREFDKQTIEFHALLNPLRDNFSLWLLNMFYCRMVARPETIKSVGLLSFDTKQNEKLYKKLNNVPRPRFGTPYVFPISAILKSKTPTRELFISMYLSTIIKSIAEEISGWNKMSVYDGVNKVIPIFGFNLFFLWTEVLIDVAYQFPQHIDLFKRFPIGPGSISTLNKIDARKDPSILVQELSSLNFDLGLTFNGEPLRLSAENWEGVGCEYRKYTNLKAGDGRKRLYKPANQIVLK